MRTCRQLHKDQVPQSDVEEGIDKSGRRGKPGPEKDHSKGMELALQVKIEESLSQKAMLTHPHNGSGVPGKILNLSVPLLPNLS